MNGDSLRIIRIRDKHGHALSDPLGNSHDVKIKREPRGFEEIQDRQNVIVKTYQNLQRKRKRHKYGREANRIVLTMQQLEVEYHDLEERKRGVIGHAIKNSLPQQLGFVPVDQ